MTYLINKIFAANTGKSPEQIELDSERDFFMSAEEAKAYGLIDSIILKTSASLQSVNHSNIDKQ